MLLWLEHSRISLYGARFVSYNSFRIWFNMGDDIWNSPKALNEKFWNTCNQRDPTHPTRTSPSHDLFNSALEIEHLITMIWLNRSKPPRSNKFESGTHINLQEGIPAPWIRLILLGSGEADRHNFLILKYGEMARYKQLAHLKMRWVG